MTNPREVQHSRFQNLKLDPEATARFYQTRDEGSNPMRMAVNEFGEKIILKSAIAFTEEDKTNEATTLSVDNLRKFIDSFAGLQYQPSFEDEYNTCVENLFAEEQASRLAKYLGIKMPESKLVFIDEVPYIAYEFLEGVKDTSFGKRITISEDLELRKEQETALAAGALIKALLNTWDDGQFLQNSETGQIVLSDLGVRSEVLIDSQAQFDKKLPDFFIIGNEEIMAHQFAGARSPEFNNILQALEDLSLESIIEIIAKDSEKPTKKELAMAKAIINRKDYVISLFQNIKTKPKEVFQKIIDLQK